MSTNRTGTARWKNLRIRLAKAAIRDGRFVCAKCGIALDLKAPRGSEHAAELDHIVPVAVDPSREYDPTNLRWLCHFHNRQKGKTLDGPRMPTTRRW